MKVVLSAPSKTFLLGEYLVLKDSQALVLLTKPRFTLTATSKSSKQLEEVYLGVHPSSPAGRLYSQSSALKKWSLHFQDPHNGLGGFGASGAQFLLTYCLLQMIETGEWTDNDSNLGEWPHFVTEPGFLQKLWGAYQEFSDGGSGADILAQLAGQITHVKLNPAETAVLNWPFHHYDFALVRTGQKVATHTHLKNLTSKNLSSKNLANLKTDQMLAAFELGYQALQSENIENFTQSIFQYQDALIEQNLVAAHTLEFVSALRATDAVAAVKGCGALGADVLFVMYKKINSAIVKDRLDLLGLPIVATSENLCCGLKTKVDVPLNKRTSMREAEL